MFTGRFSSKLIDDEKYMVISIANTLPKFSLTYKLSLQYQAIAPNWQVWNARSNPRYFELLYRNQLDSVGFDDIFTYLQSLRNSGKPLLLLCHEDLRYNGNTCHRRIFAKWWEEYTGIVVPELDELEVVTTLRFKEKSQPLFDLLEDDVVSPVIS